MSTKIKICKGLYSNYQTEFIEYNNVQVLETDCKNENKQYLVLYADEIHKLFLDIDYKINDDEQYEIIKNEIEQDINDNFGKYDISIGESHNLNKKVSFRIIFNSKKMVVSEMKNFVAECIQPKFKYNCVDLCVYRNGKIRLPYSSKDNENRPLNIIKGEFIDFITILCDKASMIDFTIDLKNNKKQTKLIDKEIKSMEKQNIQNIKVDNDIMIDILDNLKLKRCDEYGDWFLIGCALCNDGYDISLFKSFSTRSKSYHEFDEYKPWKACRENHYNKITSSSIWYMLKQDNPNKFIELRNKTDEKKYDFKLNITENHFNFNLMHQLIKDDIQQFGELDYKIRHFHKSKSFQYFNYFHMDIINLNSTFLINYIGKQRQIEKINIDGYKTFTFNNIDFIKEWSSSQFKQQYSSIEFAPKEQLGEHKFNLFTSYAYEDENLQFDINKIDKILKHIRYVCNADNVYEYVLNWLAHIVQKPYRKTEVVIVLYSHWEGVGKNAITDLLHKIFNGYIGDITLESLISKFNSDLKAKVLLIGDEITPKAKELNNELKNAITRKNLNIEYKGAEKTVVKDTANYIFTTNNERAFRVSETDRRYCLIECPTKLKNASYFDLLYKDIENDDVCKHFFNYLLDRDISNVNIRKMPMTKYKQQIIKHSLPSYFQMIIKNPENFIKDNLMLDDKLTIQRLIDISKDFEKKEKGYAIDYTDQKISKDFKRHFASFYIRSNAERYYEFKTLNDLQEHLKVEFNLNDDSDDSDDSDSE
jgi:hypothetical protein